VFKKKGHCLFQYDPVTPILSSSGEYSGGEPIQKRISCETFDRIGEKVEKAVEETEFHIPNRIKGSGMIQIEKKSFILKPDSPPRRKLEEALERIKKKYTK
jgi:hypothetical protein